MDNDTCSIDGCAKPVKRKALCYGHYMKAWRYGDPLHVAHQPKVDLRGQRFGGLVVRDYQQRHGEASRWLCDCDCGAVSAVRTGDLNSGSVQSCGAVEHQLEETAEYGAAHDRVRRLRGPASDHRCVDCDGAAAHWSYDHRDPDERRSATIKGCPPYSLNPEHYEPRCARCHRRFDATVERGVHLVRS